MQGPLLQAAQDDCEQVCADWLASLAGTSLLYKKGGKRLVPKVYDHTGFYHWLVRASLIFISSMAVLTCCLQRGLAPRVFEYLFCEIDRAQDEKV
jgi:hypothetical protein